MKILVVRFSSIGDIVLTTPVLRCLKRQLEGVELHFLTKQSFLGVLSGNPYIDRIHTIDSSIREVVSELREEKFDWVIDLHHNLRTFSLKYQLNVPSRSFDKLNWKKWKLVRLKQNTLPDVHVVDRYLEAVKHLGVQPDGKQCDFVIRKEDQVNIREEFGLAPKEYVALVVGAKFKTKQLPREKLFELISLINLPIILIGGPEDRALGEELEKVFGQVQSACGKYNLSGSASIVKQAKQVVSNDTGMMHIASCYDVPISSVWGNTVPELGMYPYRPHNPGSFSIHEVKNLNCRPCSKIGFEQCPKGHFKCMSQQNIATIAAEVNA